MRLYDAFETKSQAQAFQRQLKQDNVQYVHIRKLTGRLKYGVYVGGKNSYKY